MFSHEFFFHLFKHCNKIQTPFPQIYICIRLGLWCIKSLSTICELYRGSHDYRRGNSSTWRKSLTCRKSLTNFITQSYCCIEYTTSCAGFTQKPFNIGLYEKMRKQIQKQEIWLDGIFLSWFFRRCLRFFFYRNSKVVFTTRHCFNIHVTTYGKIKQ